MICWRFFPNYRVDIINALSSEYEILYYFGEDAPHNAVRQISSEEHKSFSIYQHKVSGILNEFVYINYGFRAAYDSFEPDIVVFQPTPRDLSLVSNIKYARKNGSEIVAWGMGKMPGRSPFLQALHDLLTSKVAQRFDRILCYSTAAQSYYRRVAPSLKSAVAVNTKVINDAVSFRALSGKRVDPKRNSRIKVVFVGRLIPTKKVEVLASALRIVEADLGGEVEVVLHVVGDGPHRGAIEAHCEAVGQQSIFYGHCSPEEVQTILSTMDVFVLPSLGGLAIVDAMCAGLPVISGPADGTECDLVQHGVNGFLTKQISQEAIADSIKAIHRSDKYGKMGQESGRLYMERFTIDRFVETFRDFV